MAVEYCDMSTRFPITAKQLNKMCIEGWEYVNSTFSLHEEGGTYTHYFKRGKPDD